MENLIKMASNTAFYLVLLFAILSVASAGYVEVGFARFSFDLCDWEKYYVRC